MDVGGTDIKAGIVDTGGNVLFQKKSPTLPFDNKNTLANQIYAIVKELENTSSLKIEHAIGLGIGLPGLVDSQNGILRFSGNLNISNYAILQELRKFLIVPIKIANDADVATLAELYFGTGVGYNNFVMLTVGTGIGGGIVIDGKPLSASRNFTGEIGHMKICDKKIKCTCGEYGCCETIASTRALVQMTKSAMKKHTDSLMWTKYNLENVSGKTVFEFKDVDETAKNVFDAFIANLGSVIVNLVNILLPEAIVLSGAISKQGKALTEPLEEYVNSHIFARHINFKIKIKIAQHNKDAGIIGASCLFKEEK